ncbi:hypothetical protein MHBO_000249 [Bonamia ostreae]|uniref:S1 motif domain-containing protein n=1 Tax=Bonamia ostreae TaxID=126728 RepID=A0ABV2AEY0_9EUKA
MADAKIVFPGQKLGTTTNFGAGKNTVQSQKHYVVATHVGQATLFKNKNNKTFIKVTTKGPSPIIPTKDDLVIGQIRKISSTNAILAISICNNKKCVNSLYGSIRMPDVRKRDSENVKIYKSFRPGDVVKAVVVN